MERVPTGIEGFDKLIEGGLLRGRSYLVTGGPGSGKTIFSMQFIYKGIMDFNEPGVYLTLEESRKNLISDFSRFGWDLKKLEDEYKLAILDLSAAKAGIPEESSSISVIEFDFNKLILELLRAIKQVGAKRVVIDSIPALGLNFKEDDDVRKALLKLSRVLSREDVVSIFISEKRGTNLSYYGVEEYLADGVFVLQYLDTGIESIKRTIYIRKMRATKHDENIHPIEITNNGIVVKRLEDVLK